MIFSRLILVLLKSGYARIPDLLLFNKFGNLRHSILPCIKINIVNLNLGILNVLLYHFGA
jgi:hypothetical protein